MFYREVSRLTSSPWAWINSDVGNALMGAKRELTAAAGSLAIAAGAYAWGGPAAMGKAMLGGNLCRYH